MNARRNRNNDRYQEDYNIPARLELTVYPGKDIALRPENQTLRVLSGCARINQRGQETTLYIGGELFFTGGPHPIIVAAARSTALVIEVV